MSADHQTVDPAVRLNKRLKELGRERVEAIAEKADTTYEYLAEQLANGHRDASVKLARRLVKASDGDLVLADVREDLFGSIADSDRVAA